MRVVKLFAPLIVLVALALFALLAPAGSGAAAPAVLLAAVVAFPAAAVGAVLASGAGVRQLSVRSLLPWSSLFVALVLLAGALGLLLTNGEPWWAPAAMALAIALATFAMAASLWLLPLRPIFALRKVLAEGEQAERAAIALAESFEARPAPHGGVALKRTAGRALAAVSVLADARRWSEAARVLDCVPLENLDALRRSALCASRATISLYLGDRNRSWAALKDAFAHAKDPSLVRMLTITDALSTALDGHGEEALNRLAEIDEPTEPRTRRAYAIARAHALAAAEKLDEARQLLAELARTVPDGLLRVIALDGPASPLARELAEADSAQED